ncbi:MAG: tyrosine-type recombinase/integrase [Sphaerochaetaceae bacterium]|nr:tyrosine-type recombinase/integrase [Sphaerochaetaceae bacterium]
MAAKRRPFYLYQRKKKNGNYWYVCFIDPQTGKQMNAKSIDCLKLELGFPDGDTIKHRDDASYIAYKALESDIIFNVGSNKKFNEYCINFWTFDDSPYVRMRNNIKPNSIGREYCINMLCNFKKHVSSVVDNDISIGKVTTRLLEKVIRIAFDKGLSSGTIQMITLSFSIPLKEAVRLGYIEKNPACKLMKIERSENDRGVFIDEEIKSILKLIAEGKVESNIVKCVLLSLATGMRSGEIRALRCSDIIHDYIKSSDGNTWDKVIISKSIAPYSGVKSTKQKYSREALIPSALGELLLEGKNRDELVIEGISSEYLKPNELRSGFYKVLSDIGITEKKRSERNLTFHSLRHYYSTFSEDNNVSQLDRMMVMGHRSSEVNNRYTHVTDTQLLRAAKVGLILMSAEKSAEET